MESLFPALFTVGFFVFIVYAFIKKSEQDAIEQKRAEAYRQQLERYQSSLKEVKVSNSSTPTSISVQPTKISSTPEKRISLVDGHSRVFQNYYINGQQYTFGFPKSDCADQRVWIGINEDEVERISKSAAQRRLKSQNLSSEVSRLLNSGSYSSSKRIGGYSSGSSSRSSSSTKRNVSRYGHCNNCGKELQGDRSKPLCYSCWKSKGKPSRNSQVGYCNNCGKKLRGNIYKSTCTECYHKGYK